MADISKVIMYILIVILIIAAIYSVVNYYKNYKIKSNYYGSDYTNALSAQDPLDKCKTPAGYTDESWREHMSHHPDQYKECLN